MIEPLAFVLSRVDGSWVIAKPVDVAFARVVLPATVSVPVADIPVVTTEPLT
jgi:hypothetical protein